MNKMQALHSFWSGFGWKAYDANTVPDVNTKYIDGGYTIPDRYITYEASVDEFGNTVSLLCNLWDRSTSWENITEKEQEISKHISKGGIMIVYDSGAMWIKKGTPWAQRMGEPEDDMVRRIVLNYEIEFIE